MDDLKNKYWVKKSITGTYQEVTGLFDGVRILKLDGFLSSGKAVNVYTAQWINSDAEDFMITTSDNNTPVIIREKPTLELTFIVRKKYATNANTFDAMTAHDAFVEYMTKNDVWIASLYAGYKYAHCVCLDEYKPTTVKLQRGDGSWIMGTIRLHCLESPSKLTQQEINNL